MVRWEGVRREKNWLRIDYMPTVLDQIKNENAKSLL